MKPDPSSAAGALSSARGHGMKTARQQWAQPSADDSNTGGLFFFFSFFSFHSNRFQVNRMVISRITAGTESRVWIPTTAHADWFGTNMTALMRSSRSGERRHYRRCDVSVSIETFRSSPRCSLDSASFTGTAIDRARLGFVNQLPSHIFKRRCLQLWWIVWSQQALILKWNIYIATNRTSWMSIVDSNNRWKVGKRRKDSNKVSS